MRNSILILIFVCSIFTTFSQTVNIQLQPEVVAGKFRAIFTIENNMGATFAPAFSTVEASVDSLLVDFSSRNLVYSNSRWSTNPYYNTISLDSVSAPSGDVFSLTIEASGERYNLDSIPTAVENLAPGELDTIAIVEFDLIDRCTSSSITHEIISQNLIKWYSLPAGPGPSDDISSNVNVVASPDVYNYVFTMPSTTLTSDISYFCEGPSDVYFELNGFVSPEANNYTIDFRHWDGITTSSLQTIVGDTALTSSLIDVGDSVYVVLTDVAASCVDTTNSILFSGPSTLGAVNIIDQLSNQVSGGQGKLCLGHQFLRAQSGAPLPAFGQWLYADKYIPGETSITLSNVNRSGAYKYMYSDNGICWDTTDSYRLQIWPTPIDSINASKTLLCGLDTAELVTYPMEGGALVLNGFGDYLDAGSSVDFGMPSSSSFTIEAVIERRISSNSEILKFNNGGAGYKFFVDASNDLLLEVQNGSGLQTFTSFNSSIPNNFKRHVAVVVERKDSSVSFYVNGILTDRFIDAKLVEDFNPVGTNLLIGNNLEGTIDEVRLWKEALSQENINTLRSIPLLNTNSQLPYFLVGYWHMDNNTNNLPGILPTLNGSATLSQGDGFFKPGGSLYTWNGPSGFFSANNDTVSTTLPGNYRVTIDNTVCTNISDVLNIDGVVINTGLPSDTTLCENQDLVLNGPVGLNYNYLWSNDGNGTGTSPSDRVYTFTPNASITNAQVYVEISRLGDCPIFDTVNVTYINSLVFSDTASGYSLADTAFMSWDVVDGAYDYSYKAYRTVDGPPATFTSIGTDTSVQFYKTNPGIEDWTFELMATGFCGTDTVTSNISIGYCVNFSYSSINDSAVASVLTDSLITFVWNPAPLATFYEVEVQVNGVTTVPWSNNGPSTSYSVNGLTYGDSVCFNYRARTSCDTADALQRCMIAFNCRAGFTGLRDTSVHYCTSSFKDLLEPDSVNNITGSYFFEGPGINYGAGLWYFDPQEASDGLHTISMVGCYGADTAVELVRVLPAPCAEIVTSTTINVPYGAPQGIYTDCDGQIYFSEFRDQTIVKIDTFGVGTTLIGINGVSGFQDGPRNQAILRDVTSVLVDPFTGDLFFSDYTNNAIRKYDLSTDSVITLAGGGLNSFEGVNGQGEKGDSDNPIDYAQNLMFDGPSGIIFNETYDTLYVSDSENKKIKAIVLSDNSVVHIAGTGALGVADGPALLSSFAEPGNLTLQGDELFIADKSANQIRVYNTVTKQVSTLIGDGSNGFKDGHISVAKFNQIADVGTDGQGSIFFLSEGNCALRILNEDTVRTLVGDTSLPSFLNCGSGINQLGHPTGLSVYVDGFIDIVDTDNNRLVRWAIEDFLNSPNGSLDTSYCASDDIDTLNVNTVSGYYTSVPTGFVSDNGTHWVFNPQVDTGFVTIYFNHTLGACSGTDERTVYVSPYPNASLGNDTLFCKNYFGTDSIRLDSTSASYQWSFRSNDSLFFFTDVKDTLHHINADSAGDYAVVIVNEFGCSSTDTMNITERPIIDLTFNSSNGDTLCYGETTALSIENIDPTDPALAVFNWSTGDTSQTIAASQTRDYYVDIEDVLGCASSDTFSLFVKNKPFALIQVDTTIKNETNNAFYGEYISTIFAGRNQGYGDGVSTSASFDTPWDVFFFNDTLYVTENGYIRNIAVNDTLVSTVAGGGTAPINADSLLLFDAQFNNLRGIVIDSNNRIIVVDNHGIKRIENDSVFIFAGDPITPNFVDGNGNLARFNNAQDIILDHNGNVYVADHENNRIRVIDINGFVTTYAGSGVSGSNDGNGVNADFSWPDGISFDTEGKMYITQELSNRIAVIDEDTNVSHYIGTGLAGFNSSIVGGYVENSVATFNKPSNAVTDPQGVVFFTEFENSSIRAALPNDSVLTILGNGKGNSIGIASASQLFEPNGITIDPNTGVLYVADTRNHQIKSLTKNRVITVCRETAVDLDASASIADDYQWFHQRVLIPGATNPIVTASDSGWYTLRIRKDGCANFDSIYVGYYASPNPNIDTVSRFNGGPVAMSICPDDTLTLIGNEVNPLYTYLWEDITNTPLSTDTLLRVSDAGTYNLEITTENGCKVRDTIIVSEFISPLDLGNDTTTCRGVPYTFDAGAGFVDYLWHDNSFAQTFTSDTGGTFSVTIETINGCFFSDSVDLTIIIPDSIDITPDSLALCTGDSAILTTSIFGSSTGTYLWNNGVTLDSNYANTAGYEVVEYTDAVTTCISYDSILVTILAPPTFASLVSDSIFCYTDTVQLIGTTSTLGDSIYLYSVDLFGTETLLVSDTDSINWNGVDSSDVVQYIYTVYNGACSLDSIITVQSTDVIASIISGSDTICFGDSISLDATSSTGTQMPLSYKWSESITNAGSISDTIGSFIYGTPTNDGNINEYYLEVTDNLGCTAYDTVGVFLNEEITALITDDLLVADKDTIEVCWDGIGAHLVSLRMNVNGGLPFTTIQRPGIDTAYYQVKWSVDPIHNSKLLFDDDEAINPTIFLAVPIPDTITAYVLITDSLGCTKRDSVIFQLRILDLDLSVQHDTICPLLSDSIIINSVTGGSGNYSYSWFPSVGSKVTNISGDSVIATFDLSSSGDYKIGLYVLDNVYPDCEIDQEIFVNVRSLIAQTSSSGIICDGDTANIDASSSFGSVPFTDIGTSWPYAHKFEWSNLGVDATSIVGVDTADIVQITGGVPGTSSSYQVIVSDSIGCSDTLAIPLQWNASIVSTVLNDTVYTCNDLTDTLRAVATGGVSNDNFTYDWIRLNGDVQLPDNGGLDADSNQNPPVFFIPNLLSSDTSLVQLTVTDTVGCITIDSAYVINNNLDFITVPTYDTICADVSNQITVEFLRDSNATGDYTFNWYDPADVGYLFVDSIGSTQTNNTREPWAITGFTRTFELELTDNVSGCVDTASSVVFIFNINPVIGLLPWDTDDMTVACYGDDVVLTSDSSTGGTPFAPPAAKYIYNWSKSITSVSESSLPLTVTNDSSVTITSNGSESNYSIWVLELTDNAGCSRSDSTTIYWNEPIVPVLENDTVFVCTPDTSYLKVDTNLTSGGISPYTVTWTKITSPGGAATLLSSIGDSVNVMSVDNDTTYFQVVVTDTAGCIGIDTVVVIGVYFEVDALVSSAEVCAGFNDTLSVQLSGDYGTDIRYAWSPNIELNDSTLASPVAQPTVDRLYSVLVYDSLFGCSAEDTVSISIVDLTAIAGSFNGLDTIVACFETDTLILDGSLSFGGVPISGGGYNYSWSTFGSTEVSTTGGTTNSTLTVIEQATSPIDTTVLQLIVTDLFGCVDTDYVAVYWNSEIQTQITDSILYSCSENNVSTKAISPTGGTPGYAYSWSVLSGTATPTGTLLTDSIVLSIVDNNISTFRLEITDTLMCSNSDTAEIRGVEFQVSASAQFDTICSGLNDTLYAQILNDGIGGYSYSWTPTTDINDATLATPVVSPQVPTLYTVTIFDSTTNCIANASIQVDTIFLNAVAGPTFGIDTLLRCFEDNTPVSLDGSLTNRGTAPYNYTWSSPDASANVTVPNANPGEIDRGTAGDGTASLVYLDVIDNIGCTARDSLYVLWNSELVVGIDYDTVEVPFLPPLASVCVSIPKELNGLISGGSGSYTYQWSLTGSDSIFIVPGTDQLQDVEIGSSATNQIAKAVFTVTDNVLSNGSVCLTDHNVDVIPFDINVDVIINEDTVCPGTEITLSATSTLGIGLNPEFSWDDEISYSLQDQLIDNPIITQYYRVYVIDDSTGCKDLDSVAVTVIDLESDISIAAGFNSSMCYLDSVLFEGTAIGGAPGPYLMNWYEVPSNISLSNNDVLKTQPTVVRVDVDYKYVIEDVLGCKDSSTVSVFRNDSIIADAGLSQILCSDQTLTIGGSPTGDYLSGGGVVSDFEYTWTGKDLSLTSSANPTFDPQVDELTLDTIYELSVIVKDDVLDCYAYDTVLIDVRALPRANFATTNAFVCADESKILYAYGVDPLYTYPAKTTFEWTQIDVIPTTVLPFTSDSAIISTGGEYRVVVTDSNSCVNSTQVNLNEVEQPKLDIQSSFSQLLCGNQVLDLTMINLDPEPIATDTLQWEIIRGLGYIDNELSQSTFYNTHELDDTLEIKAEFINKCATGSDTIRFSVVVPPVAEFTVTDSTVNVTESVVFTNNSYSPSNNVLSYRWDFNAPNINSSFNFTPPDITYFDEGSFDAQLAVLDNSTLCSDTMTITMYVNGTHLLYIPNVFSPNATNQENRTLKMYGYGLLEDDFVFTVYNRWGEKVYEQTSFSEAINIGWTGEYNNTGEPLDMGVYTYIVRAKYLDGTSVEKVGTITLLR